MQESMPANSMNQHSLLPTGTTTPRRALQTLSPNAQLRNSPAQLLAKANTPNRDPSALEMDCSSLISAKQHPGQLLANNLRGSRKRSFGLMTGSDRFSLGPSPKLSAQTEKDHDDPPIVKSDIPVDTESAQIDSTLHPPNLPLDADVEQDTQHELPDPSQQSSFSSLVDYNPPSTQNHTSEPPSAEVEDGSLYLKMKTEDLRTRLQMAMFRIQTRQVNVPFTDLRLPPTNAAPSRSSSPSSSSSTPHAAAVNDEAGEGRRKGRAAGAEASPTPAGPGSCPKPPQAQRNPVQLQLLPAPVLRPTPADMATPRRASRLPPLNASPCAKSALLGRSDVALHTPMRQKQVLPRLERPASGTSSPEKRDEEAEPTSSVVKGRAVSVLLELRNGA